MIRRPFNGGAERSPGYTSLSGVRIHHHALPLAAHPDLPFLLTWLQTVHLQPDGPTYSNLYVAAIHAVLDSGAEGGEYSRYAAAWAALESEHCDSCAYTPHPM